MTVFISNNYIQKEAQIIKVSGQRLQIKSRLE